MHIACAVMRLLAPDVMLVLGQVGQVTEIGERANHADGFLAAQGSQKFFQGSFCLRIRIPAKRHRQPADLLYQRESLFAFLFAYHVTQNAAQPAYVVDQRPFMAVQGRGLALSGGLAMR